MKYEEKEIAIKTPAANARFGASGGVSRSKSSANLQVLHPA